MGQVENQQDEQQLVLGCFFPYRLSVLSQVISGSIADIYTGRFDLKRAEWRVLAALGEHQPMSAKEIATYTHMEKMPVSRAITVLKDRGILSQQVDERDRRYSRLTLTEQGVAIYQEIVPGVLRREQELLSVLSDEEKEALGSIMDRLNQRAEALQKQAT